MRRRVVRQARILLFALIAVSMLSLGQPLQPPAGSAQVSLTASQTFTTAYILRNTGFTSASVEICYYNAGGGIDFPEIGCPPNYPPVNIGRNAEFVRGQSSDGLANGWFGGVVLTTDQKLVGVVSVSGSEGDADFYTTAQSGATAVFLPAVYRRYGPNQDTEIAVQNTTAFGTNIQVQYYDRLGNPPVIVGDYLPRYATHRYRASSTAGLLDGYAYSVRVVSLNASIPLVAGAMVYRTDDLMTYTGLTTAGTTVHLPAMYRLYGAAQTTTGFVVQNLGSGNANVTATYWDSGGASTKQEFGTIIGQYRVWARSLQAHDGNLGNWEGSIVLQSDQPIVAVASMERQNTVQGRARGMMYAGLASGAWAVHLPAIYRYWGPNNSSFVVKNVGDKEATITATYYDRSGVQPMAPVSVVKAANATWTRDQLVNDGLLGTFSGSAVLTSNQPIAAIAIDEQDFGASATLLGYEGLVP